MKVTYIPIAEATTAELQVAGKWLGLSFKAAIAPLLNQATLTEPEKRRLFAAVKRTKYTHIGVDPKNRLESSVGVAVAEYEIGHLSTLTPLPVSPTKVKALTAVQQMILDGWRADGQVEMENDHKGVVTMTMDQFLATERAILLRVMNETRRGSMHRWGENTKAPHNARYAYVATPGTPGRAMCHVTLPPLGVDRHTPVAFPFEFVNTATTRKAYAERMKKLDAEIRAYH